MMKDVERNLYFPYAESLMLVIYDLHSFLSFFDCLLRIRARSMFINVRYNSVYKCTIQLQSVGSWGFSGLNWGERERCFHIRPEYYKETYI